MLLKELKEYSTRLQLPPRLYSANPVRYIIELDGEGRLLLPQPIDTADPSNAAAKRGVRRLTPSLGRAVGIKPFLINDKSDYALGYVSELAKPERVAQCHAAFVDLVERCVVTTEEPKVRAVLAFLRNRPVEKLEFGEKFDAGSTIGFRVDGVFPTDLPAVQAFWADENDPARANAPIMHCIVCGIERPVLERLELKVKGVPEGQTAGTSIISFNADAFESYGLAASLNAPTCVDCGERFTRSANQMLSPGGENVRLNNVAYVFWTKNPQSDLPFAVMLNEPDPEVVREFLRAAHSARSSAVEAIDTTPFYSTAFSGSGGRAVVRDWIETTLGEAKKRLARWFQLQRITYISPDGPAVAPPLSIRQLAYATVRTGDRTNPPSPNISRSLMRAAFQGSTLPDDLIHQVVRRIRAEQPEGNRWKVGRTRAALIKMVLLSQRDEFQEDDMVELDETNKDPGYLCGRLLAVLEQAQRQAMPGVNATVVDRFYGTASSAPASVFGRLLRGVQPHLARLERDRKGAWVGVQRRLEEVQADLTDFPTTLTLRQQGLFALGYYHERARRWAKADPTEEDASDGTNEIEEE